MRDKKDKKEKKVDPEIVNDGDYSVGSSTKNNVIAYIVCVIAAVLLWLLIMNLDQPVNIPLSTADNASTAVSGVVLWEK